MKKIARKTKKAFNLIKQKIQLFFARRIYVSFGENCLTDNILERHNLKLITTPYSHGRTNIEYIIQLEQDNYKDFLNPEFLQYEDLNEKKVPRLKKYNNIQNQYNELHENGVEFTHHDVIASREARQKMQRRVDKLQKLKGKKSFIILYHHRVHPQTNQEKLLSDLNKIKELYSSSKIRSEVICFTQKIIHQKDQRNLEYELKNGIHYFIFHTQAEWAGGNDDLFWARTDEDLIRQMINSIKSLRP
jgi:glycosyltransferase involved in cell wall biosynthesis